MAKSTKKLAYVEPADYFPKELRKKYKLGEYDGSAKKKPASSGTAKKKVKRK